MIPQPKSDDGSHYSVCTDIKDHKWEIVDRTISRNCEATVDARRDLHGDYQHFTCLETTELFIRPVKVKPK